MPLSCTPSTEETELCTPSILGWSFWDICLLDGQLNHQTTVHLCLTVLYADLTVKSPYRSCLQIGAAFFPIIGWGSLVIPFPTHWKILTNLSWQAQRPFSIKPSSLECISPIDPLTSSNNAKLPIQGFLHISKVALFPTRHLKLSIFPTPTWWQTLIFVSSIWFLYLAHTIITGRLELLQGTFYESKFAPL